MGPLNITKSSSEEKHVEIGDSVCIDYIARTISSPDTLYEKPTINYFSNDTLKQIDDKKFLHVEDFDQNLD